jgi:NAD(P)-dependent dehydrogenase (short-subunit alcohol dehydrogenase family)
MKLDGSVAVVTGGARGIGKAITKALLQNKAKVIYMSILLYLSAYDCLLYGT